MTSLFNEWGRGAVFIRPWWSVSNSEEAMEKGISPKPAILAQYCMLGL
jgi:hypothetical protein